MTVFREYSGQGRDRSAEDRRRHRQLVEDSIKKNIGQIIAEESIIGQSKDKKIKIPIRGLKEYQFIFGENKPGVGTGSGEERRGQRLARDKAKDGQNGSQPGNEEGEDIYETEVTIEELIHYLFEDLQLPFMERKKLAEIEAMTNFKRQGYQRKGIPPRLAKRRTVVEKIKRKQATQRTLDDLAEEEAVSPEIERFPFNEDDLRYHRIKSEPRKESNAVVICIMDTSGSMDQNKKYLARSFFFLLYQFVRLRYEHVEVVFIAHSTEAKEVGEDDFFHRGESGGTMISSGYKKALNIIEERYNPEIWNIYAFHCSDGENWMEDNEKAVRLAGQLCQVCNLFGYGEIVTAWSPKNTMRNEYEGQVKHLNFCSVSFSTKEDVWPAFRQLLLAEPLPE